MNLFGCICDGSGRVEYAGGHDQDGFLLVEVEACPGCRAPDTPVTGTTFPPIFEAPADDASMPGVSPAPGAPADGGAAMSARQQPARLSGPARSGPQDDAAQGAPTPRAA